MSDVQDLTNKLLFLAVLKKQVAAIEADVRESTQMAMQPGERQPGKAGDTRIGFVTLTDPKGAYRVTGGEKWREWVREHRPDEIVSVESVRSSFEAAMLERGCDENGEPLPGVQWVDGASIVQVRPTSGAADAIRAELDRAGLTFTQALDSFSRKGIAS